MNSQPTQDAENPLQAAVELLHRTNNFLTLCMAQTELALESQDPEELLEALRAIHGGAAEMAGHSQGARVKLLQDPPATVSDSAAADSPGDAGDSGDLRRSA